VETLKNYRAQILLLLEEYSAYQPSYGQVEIEQIIDQIHDHYQLMSVGWNGHERVHGCLVHIDIKNGKIWIQHDGTEEGIAQRLVEAGVPKDDIVLAFQAPFKRQFSEFAIG
jgi:hypothetical protein